MKYYITILIVGAMLAVAGCGTLYRDCNYDEWLVDSRCS